FEYFQKNQLPYLECRNCGDKFFYPRTLCIRCHSSNLDIKVSKGLGKIFALTRIHKKDNKKVVYGIIELLEGFRMYSNIIEDNNVADIGKDVKVIFIDINGRKYPIFKTLF
ncbi:MAG: zinc ribbon domain-containing protein, partial [Metallosphaera sp.]